MADVQYQLTKKQKWDEQQKWKKNDIERENCQCEQNARMRNSNADDRL